MASIEERFQAAINVIKGLPKHGPYQPSTSMMLQFYGLFKQASEGPCKQKRPAFWDIVGRAKWDAWNSNRHLTKQQAMQKYVDGLREIIETMSFTADVQNFVGSISDLDNINLDELEMIAPGMRQLAESHPSSPFNSRTNSPQHGTSTNVNGHIEESPVVPTMNGHHFVNGAASTKFSEASKTSLTTPPPIEQSIVTEVPPTHAPVTNGVVDQSDDEYGDPYDLQNELAEALNKNSDLLKQIQAIVARMNADVAAVTKRMGALEKSLLEVNTSVQDMRSTRANRLHPKWWPLQGISPLWFVLLVLWPFVAKRIGSSLSGHRRN